MGTWRIRLTGTGHIPFKQTARELANAADRLLAKRESTLLRQIGE